MDTKQLGRFRMVATGLTQCIRDDLFPCLPQRVVIISDTSTGIIPFIPENLIGQVFGLDLVGCAENYRVLNRVFQCLDRGIPRAIRRAKSRLPAPLGSWSRPSK